MTAAATLETLTPERRALLAKLLREKQQAERDGGPRPRPAGTVPPLSCAQERLWLLEQIEPGRALYNVPGAVHLLGALDAQALRAALDALVARHEALRTTFPLHDGAPRVQVAEQAACEFACDDAQSAPDPEGEARRLAQADAARPFDLERGPLLRARLVRLRPDEHVLALTLHHIVSDGWSLGLLVQEWVSLYEALRSGRTAALPALALQYGDFATWQRDALAGPRLAAEGAWWRQTLAGAPTILELPSERARPAQPTHAIGIETRRLAPAVSDAVRSFARRAEATPFMVLLAAFQALVARLSGRDDLLVGTPVAGRTHEQLEGLVGCFVNTLVLRGDLRDDPGFGSCVARARAAVLAAQARQEFPFERLVEELQPRREPGRNPLFQVFFALHTEARPLPRVPGLRVRPFDLRPPGALFDLSLSLHSEGETFVARAEYAADLFDAPAMERLLGQYETLLAAGLRDPERPVSRLPLLAPHERTALVAGDAERVDFGETRSVSRLIEAQAARTPQAVALRCDGRSLTYAELNARANRLARELRARGVGSEARVGLCLERSLELVIALLAIHKAGGAYVPLDPSYPRERLAGMLADAQPALVLTQSRLLARLPEDAAPYLHVEPGFEGAGDAFDLPGEAHDDGLAYVIFTSGSTGRPKGAMNTHAGLRNRLLWMQAEYGLGPDDVVLQKTPFSFDVSVWEFFWPLMVGARLVLARPGGHQDAAYLARLVRDERVTTLHFVPSMLRLFLEEPATAGLDSLRRVVCSGEALPHDVQESFFARFACGLHNLYGPTEAAVDVSYWVCRRGDARRLVPIGRPVANTRLLVLDRHGEPTPPGVPGELFIGGVQVGRGYLGRPDLTADRFVPDPFEPGARLYRTGDLARRLEDGALDFLGRIDHQVKVRGQRIEPGEIEVALRAHARVRDAAVVARRDAAGDTSLVAYVVADEGHDAPDAAALRAFLGARLPESWLPAAFIALPALPLNPSGKLDRRALPAPDAASAAARPAYEAPDGASETRVAAAFARALALPAVGRDDDFFALGGDSFKAIRAARELGGDLPVVELFRHPSVRALAAQLEARAAAPLAGRDGEVLVELRPTPPGGVTLVAVPYGGGDPIAYATLARALPREIGLLVLDLDAASDNAGSGGPGGSRPPLGSGAGFTPAPRDASVAECTPARRYQQLADAAAEEVLRRVPGPFALYGHCVGTALTVELARRLEQRGRAPRAVVLAAALPPRRAFHRLVTALIRLRNRWSSDAALHRRLRALGGFDGDAGAEETSRLMQRFRRDVDAALASWSAAHARGERRVQAETLLIFGDRDPFTRAFARRARAWSAFVATARVASVPHGGHYFLKHQAPALAALIARSLDTASEVQERRGRGAGGREPPAQERRPNSLRASRTDSSEIAVEPALFRPAK
jgi:amino acid adenylation domain-containing protein